jgi:excisionase family DNA binding protein
MIPAKSRALLDSNQWPSASETARGESTTLPESPLPSSNRTVSPDPGSQATPLNPFVPKDLATPLLPASADRPLLTVREVATALGVCTATVYRICDKGELRHVRLLHAIRVAGSDLDAFIRKKRTE